MKKLFMGIPLLLFFSLSLSGCVAVGDKNNSLSLIYGITAVLSFLLLVGCVTLVRKKNFWFIALFSSVLVVNVGYLLLAVSSNLSMALWANRVSYLASVFLPLSMLMIILNITATPYKKRLPCVLLCLSVVMFLIAASPGILPIYYKEVSFAVVDGVSALVKVYGPLHSLYLLYLLGYFSAMVAVIVRANFKKTIRSTAHAVIIAIAVFVNIGVWFIEQLTKVDFEMLSVSYIISELFLLGVHLVMNEYYRMSQIVNRVESARKYSQEDSISNAMPDTFSQSVSPEQIENFMSGLKTLTPSEKSIYDSYIARLTTSEILANLNIKETTLKYHSRNLYGKLGVSTRKELLEMHKYIKSVKTTLEDIDS